MSLVGRVVLLLLLVTAGAADAQTVSQRGFVEGSGFGLHGMGHVFTRITRRADVEVAAGYRYAKSTDVTSGGTRIRNSDGSLAQIDWSGVTARAGLSFRVGGRVEENE